ncbi:MAG: phosphonoacetate hydrolase [Hyphomicrobiaceae bacterium]|nr:phosphonoacetate hydrolase [Hyphomicrobiaceae bacterium]
MQKARVELNGTTYRWPSRPVVVVCIDGGDPAYLDAALKRGLIPNTARFMQLGFNAIAECVIPSFTCPNNVSIVTGSLPAVHGISGNFYLDPVTGKAVVMTGPELMRSATVLAAFSRAGAKVVSIAAKDKLRQQLGKGMNIAGGSINFSSEKADTCTPAEHGIADVLELVGLPLPGLYSAELSLFVLAAGVKLMEREAPLLMYLSLTDYIQHTYAPEEPEALRYYQDMDAYFGRLDAMGAVVALTADHGMNDKTRPDGSYRVVWLQDVLDAELGPGKTTVICPITDYFVAHHGALGGFVRVYRNDRSVAPEAIMTLAQAQPGVAAVYDKETAAASFGLPLDREGDVAVLGDAGTCIGGRESEHDLTELADHRLRSHGGMSEARVPFILNKPLNTGYAARAAEGGLRNFHVFDFAINGVDA